ncbi:uncharacterized, partial [Tachysurus ichikawai]
MSFRRRCSCFPVVLARHLSSTNPLKTSSYRNHNRLTGRDVTPELHSDKMSGVPGSDSVTKGAGLS